MKRTVIGFAALVFTVATMAGASAAAKPEDHLKREAQVAVNSNLADTAIPQLGPNLKVGPEVPMARETNLAAGPPMGAAPGAAQRRKTMWMVLAVLAVVASSYLLQRWRSRSERS
jgi:hypothetical protein